MMTRLLKIREVACIASCVALSSCGLLGINLSKVVPASPFWEWVKASLKEEHLKAEVEGDTAKTELTPKEPGMVYAYHHPCVYIYGITDPDAISRLIARVREKAKGMQHRATIFFYRSKWEEPRANGWVVTRRGELLGTYDFP